AGGQGRAQLVERGAQHRGVARGLNPYLQGAVPGRQQHAVSRLQAGFEELPQGGERRGAGGDVERRLVEEDGEIEALGGARREARDLGGLAVLDDLEVVAGQVRHRLAVVIGDEDLDLRDRDVEAAGEARLGAGRRRLRTQ